MLVQVGSRVGRADNGPWADPVWWRGSFGYWRHGPWAGPRWGLGFQFDQTRYDREVALLIRERTSGTGCRSALGSLLHASVDLPANSAPKAWRQWAWDTVVYDRDLGDLPVWLVGPRDDSDGDIAALPEAQQSGAAQAQRMFRFFAATRERYLATSTRSRRVVAPQGSGHNFVYEVPDWTIAVLRELICADEKTTVEHSP